jgi:hypothetical protein
MMEDSFYSFSLMADKTCISFSRNSISYEILITNLSEQLISVMSWTVPNEPSPIWAPITNWFSRIYPK